jgi:CRISPR-associated endonuclease/helicase Cas3
MTRDERFRRFFSAVNGGKRPYLWQRRLVERIAREGSWPAAIAMPTGAGKSSVVDVHVFLVAERKRAMQGADRTMRASIDRPPRRLVMVAPRRALVDDQFDRAQRLAQQLRSALVEPDQQDEVLSEIAVSLLELCSGEQGAGEDASPLGVTRLRGGVRLDIDWRLDPGQCQVICATPQMWGSRLLLRGFGSARGARNLEAGLLGHDTVAVIDEAHLRERLIETASRVAADGNGPLGLQVVSMSATRTASGALRLGDEDLSDERLRRRVQAHKRLTIHGVEDWQGAAAAEMAERAKQLAGEGTVGAFVNTVSMALDVARRLRLEGTVEVVCGRMRPADVEQLRSDRPGLLDERGNPEVDYLVTTQSLEVGVDLDLPAVVTVVASASALAQRAGRLNRSGSRDSSEFVVLVPSDLAVLTSGEHDKLFAPYRSEEIVAAMQWIETLEGDASPLRISATPLPRPTQSLLPSLTRIELETFAIAGEDLSADADVDFYVEDPGDDAERAIWIGARSHLHWPEPFVSEMLDAAPPRAHELASFRPGGQLGAVLARARDAGTCWLMRGRVGNRIVTPLRASVRLQPGDVVLVPDGSRVCTGRIIGLTGKRPGDMLEDVMADRPDGEPDIVVELAKDEIESVLAQDATLGGRVARNELAAILRASDAQAAAPAAAALRKHKRLNELEITWCNGGDEDAPRGLLVLSPTKNEGALPSISLSEKVTIDDHCKAVETRVEEISSRLDIDAQGALGAEREQLLAAARWHDAGKRHPRFQERMGAQPGDPPLAKPAPGHKADRGESWRHEQLSAAHIWAYCERDVVSTAIGGGHHGHGLSPFTRGPDSLLDGWKDCELAVVEAARELFGDCGRYELERARLLRRLGLHRLSFLEALLRCADMQVSREGH